MKKILVILALVFSSWIIAHRISQESAAEPVQQNVQENPEPPQTIEHEQTHSEQQEGLSIQQDPPANELDPPKS